MGPTCQCYLTLSPLYISLLPWLTARRRREQSGRRRSHPCSLRRHPSPRRRSSSSGGGAAATARGGTAAPAWSEHRTGELRAARAGELAAERGPFFPPLSRRASLSPPPPISCAERSSPSVPDRARSSSAAPPSNSDSWRGGEARHHAPLPQLPPPARRGTSGAPRQRGVASRDGQARSPVRPSPRPTSSSPAEQRRGHGEWSRGAALPPSIRRGGLALPPRRRHQLVRGRGGHSVVELRAGGRREEEQSAAALHSLLCRRQLPWSPSSTGTTRRPRTRTAASAGRRRAGVLGAERAAASSAQSRSRTPLKREKEGDIERREREVTLTGGPHCHVASTSAKPPCKTVELPNVNGFNS